MLLLSQACHFFRKRILHVSQVEHDRLNQNPLPFVKKNAQLAYHNQFINIEIYKWNYLFTYVRVIIVHLCNFSSLTISICSSIVFSFHNAIKQYFHYYCYYFVDNVILDQLTYFILLCFPEQIKLITKIRLSGDSYRIPVGIPLRVGPRYRIVKNWCL